MFAFVSDSAKQILLLLDAGERRVPVKVVGAVRLSGKDREAPPTVGCGEGKDSFRGVASHDTARKRKSIGGAASGLPSQCCSLSRH